MQRFAALTLLAATHALHVSSHGTLNLPESRNGRQAGLGLRQGGRTQPYSVAYWFSDLTHMEGNATIADTNCSLLTTQCAGSPRCEQEGCAGSRLARMPWRAPGSAVLTGGPCGTIGWDGAVPKGAIMRGTDLLPSTEPPVWRIGGVEKVAWGLAVNHGGGYSYRLCKAPTGNSSQLTDELTEECFQRTVLRFEGNTSTIVGPRGETFFTIPASRFITPDGAEWTRNPVPDTTGADADANDDAPNFPPPVPGLAGHCCDEGCPDGCGDGFGRHGFGRIWNIMDQVRVPRRLSPGDYVLSWRWDAEELPQVWTNCADVRLQAGIASKLEGGLGGSG